MSILKLGAAANLRSLFARAELVMSVRPELAIGEPLVDQLIAGLKTYADVNELNVAEIMSSCEAHLQVTNEQAKCCSITKPT